jgi:hypothetical protein
MTASDNYKKGLLKSYNYASTFDTLSGHWENITLGGQKVPSNRIFPTATLCEYSSFRYIHTF